MFSLTTSDIEQIDQTSLNILFEIGVRIDDESLYKRVLAAGGKAGWKSGYVSLSPEMVRDHIKMAPATAKFSDCTGKITDLKAGGKASFWTGAAMNYIKGKTSKAITANDLGEFARIADSLSTIYAVVGTSFEDVAPNARDFVGFRILAQNTRKHLRPLLFTPAGVKPILEMAQIIANNKPLSECPLVSFGYSCLSPLHWSHIPTSMWQLSSGHKIPVMVNGEPISGATSPVTLAGSIALSNAEILAGIVLIQILERGRPAIYNLGFAHTTDMRSGTCLSGTAECALMAHVGGRLAAYYKLPSASWMCTDSFLDDQQASLEKMLTGYAHLTGGINVIWGMGQLQSQKALSPVQLVIDNEVASLLHRYERGFEINDETLAMNVIKDVVCNSQDFISHEHTMKHFRNELSESKLLARTTRERWESAGARSLEDSAAEYVQNLLKNKDHRCLTEQQEKDILNVEKAALKSLA